MELVRSSVSIVCGLPCVTVRSAPAITFSGPAQRSLTLWPIRSPSRLATLYIESSDSFVASAAVSIATGWNEPVPGRELHPLKSSAFHGALLRQPSENGCVELLLAEGFHGIADSGKKCFVHGHESQKVVIRHVGFGKNPRHLWPEYIGQFCSLRRVQSETIIHEYA